jgi:pyruvate dehydrogenase E2 component (dihydrolipoamide acetyltransferase)
MEEGTIAKWHKKEGEFIESGELLLEIVTDKATVEHNALDEGWLKKILIPEGGSATVNQPIAIFTAEEKESIAGYAPHGVSPQPPKVAAAPEMKAETKEERPTPTLGAPLAQPAFIPEAPLAMERPGAPAAGGRTPASPLARRLAKKRGLDLSTVKGTGPGGRITSKDLERAQPAGLVTFGRVETPTIPPGTYEEIPLTPMRKAIARRLQESKSFIPHYYLKQTIDAAPLVAFREQLKAYDLHVTYNDLIIRACALALREHPGVNTGFNSVNQTIIQFKTIDISIAVDIEAGLITPIIRHADYKNLGQISLEARQLVEKARAMKLKEHEYKGGSFSISNLGMFGLSGFFAVINPPQAAILAVGSIEDQAVVREGKVVCGKTMPLILSADHRVIDGALGAKFLKTVQKLLQNPVALTL